ncbi:MAG TPA: hypothetical protein PK431_11140 [Chitinophagales bacterium]|nr:hypothetical protein [Chitinophagales bacterium]
MKKIAFVLFILTITILISCKKDKTYKLGIDVQSQFENDSVELFLDNEPLIKKRLSTNNLLGVCDDGIVRLTKNEGVHTLLFIVNNSATLVTNLSLNNNLYIGITYDPSDNEVSFMHSDEPFIYE